MAAPKKITPLAKRDVLMGTVYSDTVRDAVRERGLAYFPFVGEVTGHPSVLPGSIESIAAHARYLTGRGVDGVDLLTYRHEGDGARLLQEVVRSTPIPVVSAGSIGSYGRIKAVWDAGAWGFTIGSAFFDGAFSAGASFCANLASVVNWLSEEERRQQAATPPTQAPA